MANSTSIEEYVAGFPEDVAERLRQLREVIVAEVTRALWAPRPRSGFGTASQR